MSSNVNKCKPEVPLQSVPSWLGVQEVDVSPDKVVVESPMFSRQWSTHYFSIKFLHEAKLSKYLVGLIVQGGQESGGSRVFLLAQRDLAIY